MLREVTLTNIMVTITTKVIVTKLNSVNDNIKDIFISINDSCRIGILSLISFAAYVLLFANMTRI